VTIVKPADLKTPAEDALLHLLADEPVTDPPIQRPERGPATAGATAPTPVYVEVDTWIERPDLPAGNRTFVAAGDYVPAPLVGYPRTPA
jgi:hypothetical protein